MKTISTLFKTSLTLILVFAATQLFAQVPQQINYQGAVRDNAGAAVVNRPISLRLSILDNDANGPLRYAEVRKVTTNGVGLYSIPIGNPTGILQKSGDFAQIPWGVGKKYLKVEVDVEGGDDYVLAGASELLSVPYALYAKYAENGPVGAQGPAGAAGSVILSGPNDPSNNIGKAGDYYFNTITHVLFGPKNPDGTWPPGTVLLDGPIGATGPAGPIGADGLSAYEIWEGLPGNDGKTITQFLDGLKGATGATGPQGIAGATGATGPIGADGLSAYEIWEGLPGNDGKTITQFLDGLKGATGATGPQGATGPIGPNGLSAYELWEGLPGNDGKTLTEFLDGLKGADGADGLSAYEIWEGLPGNDGKTITEFFDGLKGATGATGPRGATGPIGPNGLSAYEVWEGLPGNDGKTITEFLDGLKGATGATGPQGPAGGTATTLTNAHIFVGDGANTPQDVPVSGDATLDNTGALTVNNGAITLAKMANGIPDRIYTTNLAGTPTLESFNNIGWALRGNTGTVDGTHFMGTTDNKPLNFRVNNLKAGRITSDNHGETTFGLRAGSQGAGLFNNTLIGFRAGELLRIDCHNNTFIGALAGAFMNGGSQDNVAIGQGALVNMTSGGGNLALGDLSGSFVTTGSNNTFLGFGTGLTNDGTLDNVVLIGTNANGVSGISNATAIGSNASVTASNSLALGAPGSAAINVGIAISAPTERLDVRGNVKINDGVFKTTQPSSATTVGINIDNHGINSASPGAIPLNNVKGQITGVGANDGSDYSRLVVTFSTPPIPGIAPVIPTPAAYYDTAPVVTITPANAAAADTEYFVTSTANGFVLAFKNRTLGQNNPAFNYWVIQ